MPDPSPIPLPTADELEATDSLYRDKLRAQKNGDWDNAIHPNWCNHAATILPIRNAQCSRLLAENQRLKEMLKGSLRPKKSIQMYDPEHFFDIWTEAEIEAKLKGEGG